MSQAIGLMENAFRVLSEKSAYVPQRVVMNTPDDSMAVFFKPAFLNRFQRMSVKILTQILDAGIHDSAPNQNHNHATIKGMVLLIDMVTGSILSVSDGQSITALRTGAASGIATSWLANKDASSLALFGCGAQGKTQIEGVISVRPIKKVYLFDLSTDQANNLRDEMKAHSDISFTVNPGLSVLKEVDVICTATPGTKPLFSLSQVKRGVHINAVGSFRPDMQEIDPEILKAGMVYLDDAPACLKESGDLIVPLSTGLLHLQDVMGELGELIAGTIPGRKSPDDITIFKTVGNAIQDFFIANQAYNQSLLLPTPTLINLTS